jgi:hypothetical protein
VSYSPEQLQVDIANNIAPALIVDKVIAAAPQLENNRDGVLKSVLGEITKAAPALEWATPAHEEIDLATLNPEDYDPFDEFGAQLIDSIGAAKAKRITFFESIALPLVKRGLKVAPAYPKEKRVHTSLVPRPLEMQSSDPAQIRAWAQMEPNANVITYAAQVPGGYLFLDKDGAVSLRVKYERETGNSFPKTLLVRSSVVGDGKGGTITKGHWYFRQTPGTIALSGNIPESKTGGLFSLRVHNEYVASIGSVHPTTGKPYAVAEDYPILPMPDELLVWLQSQVLAAPKTREEVVERGKFGKGTRYPALISEVGRLWARGYSRELVISTGLAWAKENFEIVGAFDETLVKSEIEHLIDSYKQGTNTDIILNQKSATPTLIASDGVASLPVEDAEVIPSFDPSVVNGIYEKFVDVCTRGTTMAPQFVYSIAKTIVGVKMAGKVKFENLDVEPRFYTALIGETGSGKGESWRRVFQVLNCEGQVGNIAGLKIINSADSGAGIRDTFFEPPEELPILMYIDEVESFGNKAAATRNPAIMDMLIELADSTQISRVKAAKKGKANTTKNDARLSAVMCGQDGFVYMKAFAGRTKLGLWDRLYPEYSVPTEAGDLPPIATGQAYELLNELKKLDYSGTMSMSLEARGLIDKFWSGQPTEVRKKARWKKNLTLDAYMSAFGRGSKVAELTDVEIAIKIFTRQLVIRRVHFTSEVPDRTGYYLGLVKKITELMRRQLKGGARPEQVALSRREYERRTNASRDNEEHLFEKARQIHHRAHLTPVRVEKANGHVYDKFLPLPEEDE